MEHDHKPHSPSKQDELYVLDIFDNFSRYSDTNWYKKMYNDDDEDSSGDYFCDEDEEDEEDENPEDSIDRGMLLSIGAMALMGSHWRLEENGILIS